MLDLKKTHLKETVMKKPGIVLTLACVVSFAQMMWAQAAPAGQIPDETVVAKIDGKNVTAGEVRNALATMPADFGRLYQQDPKLAIQQLYVLRHLAEEGEKAKLGEQSPMKEQLEIMRANVLASAMLSREHNNYGVSEEMIKEYYERNQAKFQKAKIKLKIGRSIPKMLPQKLPVETSAWSASIAGMPVTSKARSWRSSRVR